MRCETCDGTGRMPRTFIDHLPGAPHLQFVNEYSDVRDPCEDCAGTGRVEDEDDEENEQEGR